MTNTEKFLKDYLKERNKRCLIEKIRDIKDSLASYSGEGKEYKQAYIDLVNRLCDLEIKLEEIGND